MDVVQTNIAAKLRDTQPLIAGRLSPSIGADVERLLAGRTRDIRLSRELTALFRERSWPQAAKIIRAWMAWVIILDVLTLAVNAVLLPAETVVRMLEPASILPPAALAVALVYVRPRALWLEGAAMHVGLFLILLSVALVGVSAGGEF